MGPLADREGHHSENARRRKDQADQPDAPKQRSSQARQQEYEAQSVLEPRHVRHRELTHLVPAEGQARAVVALDPQLDPEGRAEVRGRVERRRRVASRTLGNRSTAASRLDLAAVPLAPLMRSLRRKFLTSTASGLAGDRAVAMPKPLRIGRLPESGHRESDGGKRRRDRRPAGFCQEQTLVLTEQFSSMERDAFHVSYLSDKIPEAVFHGQA